MCRRRTNTLSRVVRARGRNNNIYNGGDRPAVHAERAIQLLRPSSLSTLRLVSVPEHSGRHNRVQFNSYNNNNDGEIRAGFGSLIAWCIGYKRNGFPFEWARGIHRVHVGAICVLTHTI